MSPLLLVNGRDFLEGRDVHCGDHLQWSPDRGTTWLNVRYERAGHSPYFILPDDSRLTINRREALFRWPPQ